LGGNETSAADRESAGEIAGEMPTITVAVRENRAFLVRGVDWLAREQGVRQFLDIGTGMPAAPNVHDVAQEVHPDARVVYVDNDKHVLAHARALLTPVTPEGRNSYIDADVRRPGDILGSDELSDTLDMSKPVALLLVALLHFLGDNEDPRGIINTLVDALPDGSWIIATHGTAEYMPPEKAQKLEELGTGTFHFRSGAQFAALFQREDVQLVPPGVQSVHRWWTEHPSDVTDEDIAWNGLAARVVRKRA